MSWKNIYFKNLPVLEKWKAWIWTLKMIGPAEM